MEMPLPEIIDRFTICRLKSERIGEKHLEKEYNTYLDEVNKFRKNGLIKEEWIEELYKLNGEIWDLESDIRKGKEGELGLDEVGRRAIKIRDLNKLRVGIKNKIVEETGKGFKDVKMNHASQ